MVPTVPTLQGCQPRPAHAPPSECPSVSAPMGDAPAQRGIGAVFREPATRWLLVSCLFYMVAFMWMQFLSAWTVEHITHSTRLVQFTGFCQMGPLVFGPAFGRLADVVDKLKIDIVTVAMVTLISGVMVPLAEGAHRPGGDGGRGA